MNINIETIRNRNVCVIGAGEIGGGCFSQLSQYMDKFHLSIYDNDRRRWGEEFQGTRIISLDTLIELLVEGVDLVIATEHVSALFFCKDLNNCKGENLFWEKGNCRLRKLCLDKINENDYQTIQSMPYNPNLDYYKTALLYKVLDDKDLYQKTLKYIEFRESNPMAPELNGMELGNICNLQCPNCPVPYMIRKKGFLERNLLEEIIKYIPPRNKDHFFVHGFGEPFLHPDCMNFLKELIKNDVKFVISTNGVLLDEVKVCELLELLADAREPLIYVSFHVYESVKAWILLTSKLEKLGIEYVQVYGQVLEHNKEEAEQWLLKLGIQEPWKNERIRYITSHSFAGHVEGRKKEYTPVEVKNRIRNCYFLNRNIVNISWDGNLRTCCFDAENDMNLGTIFDMKNIRHRYEGYSICSNCDPDWATSFQ